MNQSDHSELSRRKMMKVVGAAVALGSAVVVGGVSLRPQAAAAASRMSPGLGTEDLAELLSKHNLTDLHGAVEEYRKAVSRFPYVLPEGTTFPSVPSFFGDATGALWERGSGQADAYFFWHNATIDAAEIARGRGDVAEAERLISTLEGAYESAFRQEIWSDDQQALPKAAAYAKSGNFDALTNMTDAG